MVKVKVGWKQEKALVIGIFQSAAEGRIRAVTVLTLAEFDNDIGELLLSGIVTRIIGCFDEFGRPQNSPNGNPEFVFGSPCMCADAVL